VRNPSKVNALAEDILRELGVWKLAKGATFFGFDVQQRGIDALLHKVEAILTDRHHPLRAKLEQQAQRIMHELAQADSPSSQRLEQFKQHLLSSPTLLNFMTQAVVMLCDAMKQDLLQQQSGIAKHLQSAIQQFAESLQSNDDVRILLNQRLTELAIQLSEQYGDKVIDFVSQQIQSWDSREMIDKIENAVGKDLHMIRVNGVVVGAFIGLFLGIIRALIEWV
ncbi:MAG: DUF445 family protein, partial [Acinetobacter sp.]|nr:DUF445 family protein [Acinetobacter sp.]